MFGVVLWVVLTMSYSMLCVMFPFYGFFYLLADLPA